MSSINLEKGICTLNAVWYAAVVISIMNFLDGENRFTQGNRLSDCNGIEHTTTQFLNLGKLSNCLSCVVVLICMVHLALCFYHFTYAFQSESTLRSCLNALELLAQSWRDIGNLSDSKILGTHDLLVCKRTLDHLAKLAKLLSCAVSIYLYGGSNSVFLLCHMRV